MGKLRRALRQRRHYQRQLDEQRRAADRAIGVLRLQYRRHIPLLLSLAAGGGLLAGRYGDKHPRPPTPLVRAAVAWSMPLLRGLLP